MKARVLASGTCFFSQLVCALYAPQMYTPFYGSFVAMPDIYGIQVLSGHCR